MATAPQSALITGAASGLGRAVAQTLSKTVKTLVLWDLNPQGLAETASGCASTCQAVTAAVDLSNEEQVKGACARLREGGTIPQFVLHAAGILRTGGLDRLTADDCRKMVDVNYLGTVNLVVHLTPMLSSGAQLFCISSIAGLKGLPEFAAYCASKFAVVGFCESVRHELKARGIHLHVVCPPAVDTPMVQNLSYRPALYDIFPFAEKQQVVDRIIGQIGKTRDFIVLIDVQSRLLRRANGLLPDTISMVLGRLVDRRKRKVSA